VQLMASMCGVERCEILTDILERQRRKAKT